MRTTGIMRALDEKRGAVRVEDLYDTHIDDLWEACTTPERLARWIAELSGDLRVGGTIHTTFTSNWTGAGRIEICDRPRHLLLTMEPGTDDESELEAWLTEEGHKRASWSRNAASFSTSSTSTAPAGRRTSKTFATHWPGSPRHGRRVGLSSPPPMRRCRSPDAGVRPAPDVPLGRAADFACLRRATGAVRHVSALAV
jgi:uncharacterized protein YndB with AHSA1/START domain